MKKRLLILLCVLLLASCERPATNSAWSPINDVNTPDPSSSDLWPTLDLEQFPNPLPQSMKGYEMVSWQVGETWNFTLVTGTNRMKSFEELMQPESQVTDDGWLKITVSGVDQIKKVLERLPENSEVFWGGMNLGSEIPEGTLYFSYPPLALMNDLMDFCTERGINLQNLSEPE